MSTEVAKDAERERKPPPRPFRELRRAEKVMFVGGVIFVAMWMVVAMPAVLLWHVARGLFRHFVLRTVVAFVLVGLVAVPAGVAVMLIGMGGPWLLLGIPAALIALAVLVGVGNLVGSPPKNFPMKNF